MSSNLIKGLMSLAGLVFGALALVPQLRDYQAALGSLATGLLAWAHGRRPGDMTAEQMTAAVSKKGSDQ